MPDPDRTLALILAGGTGSRLHPLTEDRSKPAVSFGGKYRIIDFALSNCLHSANRRVLVMTQYKSLALQKLRPESISKASIASAVINPRSEFLSVVLRWEKACDPSQSGQSYQEQGGAFNDLELILHFDPPDLNLERQTTQSKLEVDLRGCNVSPVN